MASKPTSRNWNDIQLVIATGSMALTLALWNLFAGPDRETAMKRAQEKADLPPQPAQTAAPAAEVKPTLQAPIMPAGPILLGGSAPQTTIVIRKGGGGGGDGGGGVTSTGSS
ncbi:hypothetical protein ANAEL_02372 [Anaerolineales bacterium]|nr:hypothetical protein ANAEL_02372 [Anaerolineales bacterium]